MIEIVKDVGKIQKKRQAPKTEWTDIEVAQVLVAVFNLGEGDFVEI